MTGARAAAGMARRHQSALPVDLTIRANDSARGDARRLTY